MRTIISLSFAVLALTQTTSAQPAAPDDKEEGFTSLFNGKDFSGWRFSDNSPTAENWKVADGVIKLSGGGKPHLASQWDYDDFDVRFEWRAMRPNYNSGFYIRSGRNVGSNQINLAKGSEGGLVGGKIDGAKPVPDLQKKPMEWNEWRVLAVGDKITFWCNGKLAWEGSNFQAKRGFLGFQAEGAPIEFRNIRIKPIGFEPATVGRKAKEDGGKKDDALVFPAGKDSEPITSAPVGDYIFRTEWRVDKGSIARFWPRSSGNGQAIVFGDVPTGSGAVVDGKVLKKNDYPLGQWNYLEVKVAGDKATVWLNGSVVSESPVSKEPAAVAFEVTAGSLELRMPRIKVAK